MSPVPGATTTAVGNGPATPSPTPPPPPPPTSTSQAPMSSTAVAAATTTNTTNTTKITKTTYTSPASNRDQKISSQQQISPSRSQHADNGNANNSASNKAKQNYNKNNSIKNNNCNNNVFQQSHNKNNKLSLPHSNVAVGGGAGEGGKVTANAGGVSLPVVESIPQLKQQHQMQQQQQQQQQLANKNSNSSQAKVKTNDMQKQIVTTTTTTSTPTKMSSDHATSTNAASLNGVTTTKSVNNAQFTSPLGSVVVTSSPSSASLSAQTNCNTKSPTTKPQQQQPSTTAATVTSSSTSPSRDPLALPAITYNGVTSTPRTAAASITKASVEATTTKTTKINQDVVEIKEECDPQQVIAVKMEETSPTPNTATATTTTTTVAKKSTTATDATVPNQVATTSTIATNGKDKAAVAPSAEANNNINNNNNNNNSNNSNKNKHTAKNATTAAAAAADPLVTTDDASADNLIVDKPRKVLLSVINPHIICHLCNGYLIDATTIVECLHSFCHSCLIKHLRTEQYCPRCEMMINTAKPNIKSDTTLQAIVYKLVPGLYERELMRKRAFYKDRPADAAMATPEQRGEDTEHLIFSPSDYMSLSLEFADTDELVCQNSEYRELLKPRYLQCPAMCTVGHLKKFVYGKFDIDSQRFNLDIMYKVKTIVLLDHYTLMDVAYIYTWKRDAPMRFYFRVKRCLRPIVRARKPPAVAEASKVGMRVASEAVDIKNELVDATQTTTTTTNISQEITPALTSAPDAMTIIPKPVASTLTTTINKPLMETPTEIKEEHIEEAAEELRLKSVVDGPVVKPAKAAKASKTPVVSSTTESKRSHTSSSAERKAEKAQNSHNSPKTSKEKREAKEALKQANAAAAAGEQPREERKVENIKLKIDLSKQNSVTIINMSDPHRREITKSVRPEKEWKLKNKRDKECTPKNSPSSERKSKTPSPLTVPPLTIKADQISPPTKLSPLAKSSPKSTERSPVGATFSNEEDEKSQFLKSFSLTPIKGVKSEIREKSPKSPKANSNPAITHKVLVKSPTSAARDPLKTTISTVFRNTAGVPSKRKIKEPVKNVAKKPKLSPPLPVEDFKIKLPPSPMANSQSKSQSSNAKPNSPVNDKPLMPPPKPPTSTLSSTTTTMTTITSSISTRPSQAVASSNNNQAIMRPPISLPPKKTTGKMSAAGTHKMNSLPPPTQPFSRFEMAAPGNRTPIAKRYQPILPKSTRPNPFADIPSDVNQLLRDVGTEIKTIPNNEKSMGKVYGPKTIASGGTTITPDNSVMPPPPAPLSKAQPPNMGPPRHGVASNTNKLGSKNGKVSNSTNYLNLALFNASKSKGNEVPPGCRTPMYTPSSPIYSPSSPQYMPNYNIPTVPTYKYTPRPSSGNGSFLQSILGGNNNQMAGLFPAPPTKNDNSNTSMSSKSAAGNSSPSHSGGYKPMDVGSSHQAPKRVYPFARSPSPEDPPEKQLKVKSLLNSCNINIPSSLSITITREDSESQTNNTSHPKHKSPVNNYIEILKLPDQSTEMPEHNKRASPPAQKSQSSSLKLLMPPSVNTTSTASNVKRDGSEGGGKPVSYGATNLTQMSQKQQNNMQKSTLNNSNPNSVNKSQSVTPNTTTKSPQSNANTNQQTHHKQTNDNNQQKSNIKVTEPQRSPQAEQQHKSSHEKKSPLQSPEKNITTSPNGKSTHKSPNSSNTVDTTKKFRPILPRQNPSSAISEIVPPKVTTANIIGTYSAPSGVAVKVHANKKVSPPKKSPVGQQHQQQPQPQVAHQQPKNGHSPSALMSAKTTTPQSKKSPSPAHQASNKPPPASATANTRSEATPPPPPPPMSSPNTNNNNNNKLMHAPPNLPPPATPTMPSLPTMPNMPPTALQVAAMAAGLPAHLGGVSAADFSKLFKDNLLRAQVQAAAAAAQPGGMFYPYANAQQLSHHYSYQQAFMLEQFSRMQRAEALNEFMQKLKNGPADKPVENSANTSNVGVGKAAIAVAGPKASPGASGSATTKSNAGNANATTGAANNNSSSGGSSVGTSKAK